jgi:hypothetical protein
VQVDLGPVEGAVALVDLIGEPEIVERARQRRLGVVPQRVVADPLRRARRELDPVSKPNSA